MKARPAGAGRLALALILASSGTTAAGVELAGLADALGAAARRDAFEGLLSRAEVRGPGEPFTTEVVSLADGRARLVQVFPAGRDELVLAADGSAHRREAAAGPLEPAPEVMAGWVRGHAVHRMLLALDRRFRAVAPNPGGDCLDLVRDDGTPATVCRDGAGRPGRLELVNAESMGGGRVRIELADWREVHGVSLPFAVDFVHAGERWPYRFTQVLPFRLAPGVELPAEPALLLDRLGDLAEIVALHDRAMAAHLAGDVDRLMADEAGVGTVSGRGRLLETTREEARDRLGAWLEATRFSRYRDTVVPVVAVSLDGTLGWLGCEMEAEGLTIGEGGRRDELAFGFSWVELVARAGGRWVRIGNASSARP